MPCPSVPPRLRSVPLTIRCCTLKSGQVDEILSYALFFGLVCGIAAGSLNFYILTIRVNPGQRDLKAPLSAASFMWSISPW